MKWRVVIVSILEIISELFQTIFILWLCKETIRLTTIKTDKPNKPNKRAERKLKKFIENDIFEYDDDGNLRCK